MRERDIEAYLREQVKARGGWAPKWTSPGSNGVPDRIVFLPPSPAYPTGRIIFAELKAPGKKPEPLQMAQHRRLRELGQIVHVMDSREQIDELLAAYREGRL